MIAMKESKVIIGLFCAVVLWAGCASNAKKVSAADDAETVKDTTEAVTTTMAQQTPYHLDFDVKQLVMALKHYEDYELLDSIGLKLIYEDSYQNEEMEETEVMYGKDIEKAGKARIGFELKATSDHAFYYSMALDTSTRPNLGFVNQEDVKSFIENTLKTEPFDYEGLTYYIHPVEREGEQYLYIDTPYGDDNYETRYVIYPPRQENGFWRIEIEYYV